MKYLFAGDDGTAPDAAQFVQSGEAGTETVAQRIVGVVVKALVLPEGIDVGRNVLRARRRPPSSAICSYAI
jgi:hypothetical protein